MKIPKLKIGSITAEIPIVQGGMGVRVSLSSLASAVANAGGIGTLSSIGLGDFVDSLSEYEGISREALESRDPAGEKNDRRPGRRQFHGRAEQRQRPDRDGRRREGIKIIVFGAGLPTALPETGPRPFREPGAHRQLRPGWRS